MLSLKHDKAFVALISIVMIFIILFSGLIFLELKTIPLEKATYKELIEIQAIGEHKANLILNYIQTHKDCTVEDLGSINGIGDVLIERLSEHYH